MPQGAFLQHNLFFQGNLIWLWIIALIAGVVLAFFAYRITNPPVTTPVRYLLFSLRTLAFAALVFTILDPLWSVRGIEERPPSVAVIADNSQSIALSDSAVARSLFMESADILKSRFATRLYEFSDTLSDYSVLNFTGKSTALGDAMLSLRQKADEFNIKAAVVITDGQVNLGEDPANVAAKSPFPIYTVGVGSTVHEENLAVRRIISNPVAYKDVPTEIRAYIEGWGASQDVPVTLRNGNKVIAESRVMTEGQGQQAEVIFNYTPADTGRQFLQVSVPVGENERIRADNTRSFSLNVLPSKKKILIVASQLTWDVTFIRRALESNKNYDVRLLDIKGVIKSGASPEPTLDDIKTSDAVFLINCATDARTGRELADYIHEGGSVFWLLGPNTSIGADLLTASPLVDPPVRWVSDDFTPDLTLDGAKHPIFAITSDLSTDNGSGASAASTDPTELADLISSMPPMSGFFMLGSVKKSSRMLLEHSKLAGVPVGLVYESDGGRQVLFNCFDLWRWGFVPPDFGSGDEIFVHLMQNSAQWLMSKEEASSFVFSADKDVYQSGEPIWFSATVRDESGNPVEGLPVNVTILRQHADSAKGINGTDSFTTVMDELGRGQYSLRQGALDEGTFTVRANIASDAPVPVKRKTVIFTVEPYSAEMADLRINTDLLKDMADLSGGMFISQAQLKDVLGSISLSPTRRLLKNETAIWEKWWLLVLMLLLLCTEWVIRKRANLP